MRGTVKRGRLIEYGVVAVVAIALALLVQAFLIKPYRIPSESMASTLRPGDRVLVNRVVYHLRQPHRGDVMVFRYPENVNVVFIKRIVGVPGDTLQVREGRLWVNGRPVAEPYIRRRAVRHLDKGRIVIFGAGTGNPFFTTDSAAALRASEMGAEILFKATKVDGIYDADPVTNPAAKKFDTLTYSDVLTKNLRVMDAAAIALCRDNNIPILVFNLRRPGSIVEALRGAVIGTLVNGGQQDRTN